MKFTERVAVSGNKSSLVSWLGYGGLIPFLAFSALMYLNVERQAMWHADLRAYAAVILSFVGALHWGFAMVVSNMSSSQRSASFSWSVVPALIAFVALITHPAVADSLLLGGFAAQFWKDSRLARVVDLPSWYLPLRLRLSAVAILCIAAAAGWDWLGAPSAG